ncbi:hypothetical protein K470DRAFT_254261 [Piedraia hortae CBS 480.64]|uniref:Nucleoporin protein Ndc1-Nup n=1 Tax=Piedraia hortae CBS 480.64 TaxID=1314780 RepID=A0A6A7C8V8_9PEZI|nr:hypothetical protein K470DRAFT_254261 [Piedraia hortae CBS 480.64]
MATPMAIPTATAVVARHYKDFLTPAFHRRFTAAILPVLFACWAVAACISLGSGTSFFWSIFPLFSWCGLRTLALVLPCLCIFIVRIMNMHVGRRTSESQFGGFVQALIGGHDRSGTVLATLLWYSLSAWLVTEIFVWSLPSKSNLGWIDPGREYERPRVNENPLYLRTMLSMAAVMFTAKHLYNDDDLVELTDQDEDEKWTTSLRWLAEYAVAIFMHALSSSLVFLVFGTVIYFLTLRHSLWPGVSTLAHWLNRHLVPDRGPPGLANVGRLAFQTVAALTSLISLWDASNLMFSSCISYPPIKKGHPLTDQIVDAHGNIISRSRDPNGSLVRGLDAKRNVTRAFAFWELYLICNRENKIFEDRRKTLFQDPDRKPSSTWAQISSLCLAEISGISSRIKCYQESISPKPAPEVINAPPPPSLPKIASRPTIEDKDVFLHRTSRPNAVGSLARQLGQSHGSPTLLATGASRALAWTGNHTSETLTKTHLTQSIQTQLQAILASPIGAPFRKTFSSRLKAIIFNTPYSDRETITHAVKSLTALTLVSIAEDEYGQVAPTIPAIINTLTDVVFGIKQLEATLEPHWSDVFFSPAAREVEEVGMLRAMVQGELGRIVEKFEPFAGALGLGEGQMGRAREAVEL